MTQLVNIDQMTPAQLDFVHQQIMARKTEILQLEVERMKDELEKVKAENEIMKYRIENIDCTNIEGSLRDRLNRMIRLHATQKGIYFNKAYRNFIQSFNTAYRTNLELRMTNYCKDRGIKEVSTPEYLERMGLLEDAIRVADKLLNRSA